MTFARVRFYRFSAKAAVASLAICLLVTAGALTWYRIVRYVEDAQPVAVTGKPTSVAWGNRVFSSPHALEVWLRSRGISYNVWVRRHPDATGIIDPSAAPAPRPAAAATRVQVQHRAASSKAKPGTAKPAAAKPAPTVATDSRSGGHQWLVILSIALALLLGGAAAVPTGLWMRISGRAPPRLERRIYAVAVAASIFIGIAIARLPG